MPPLWEDYKGNGPQRRMDLSEVWDEQSFSGQGDDTAEGVVVLWHFHMARWESVRGGEGRTLGWSRKGDNIIEMIALWKTDDRGMGVD